MKVFMQSDRKLERDSGLQKIEGAVRVCEAIYEERFEH